MAINKPVIRWTDKQATAQVVAAANRGLKKAAESLRGTIVRKVSKSAHAGSGARSPTKGGRKPRRFAHSKPGEPPRSIDGKLRQSIFWSHDAARSLATVGTRVKHGVYMELGTRPHQIRPVRKKALVFGGWVLKQEEYKMGTAVSIATKEIVKGGVKKRKGLRSEWDWMFVGLVNHPGTKPRPYMLATLREQRDRLRTLIQAEIARVAAAGGGTVRFG